MRGFLSVFCFSFSAAFSLFCFSLSAAIIAIFSAFFCAFSWSFSTFFFSVIIPFTTFFSICCKSMSSSMNATCSSGFINMAGFNTSKHFCTESPSNTLLCFRCSIRPTILYNICLYLIGRVLTTFVVSVCADIIVGSGFKC